MDSDFFAGMSPLKTAQLDERGKQSVPDAMLIIIASRTFWFDNAFCSLSRLRCFIISFSI